MRLPNLQDAIRRAEMEREMEARRRAGLSPMPEQGALPEEQPQEDPLSMFRPQLEASAAESNIPAGQDPVIDFLRKKGKIVNDPLVGEYGQQAGSDPNLRLRLEQYQNRQPKPSMGKMPRRMF